MNHNFKDISGQRYGTLIAVDFERRAASKGGRERIFWRCKCDCGNEVYVVANSLICCPRHSCGCLTAKVIGDKLRTHGARHSRLYRIWTHILSRCRNPNVPEYHNYGGRGISVCQEWQKSFQAFAAYVGEPPTEKHSIDRYPDINGDYKPENVRWATAKQQGRNRRGLIWVPHEGKTVCLSEAVEHCGLIYGTVYSRVYKWGWEPERALKTPVRKKARVS